MAATPRRWDRAAAYRGRSYLGFRPGKFSLKIRRLLANIEPMEEGVRGFEPDAEPVGDFDFLAALVGLDLRIASNHVSAALLEAGLVYDAPEAGALAMG